MPLKIIGYDELYGWTMDRVVETIGKKGNCTYCGVFRRQALDRGAAMLDVDHVVTGHNADDIAETVLMNRMSPISRLLCWLAGTKRVGVFTRPVVLRGDIARLQRCTEICTSGE